MLQRHVKSVAASTIVESIRGNQKTACRMSATTGLVIGAATYWITQTAVAVSAASGVLEMIFASGFTSFTA